MTIKLGNSLNDLSKLVTKFEESELDLIKNVPQKLVNEFGYGGLANALMFQESKIPQYDGEKISEYMQTHTFNTLDSLVKYVKSVQGDINKLFAIFSWAALNINYDTAAYFSGNHKQATLESVFSTKLAVCEGYSLFVREMAKLANLDEKKIVIKPYSNYAKGYSFNGLNPPKDAKSNHASVYVQINGVPFLSEPTWAAGSIGSDKQFKKEYSPELFLIPIYKTLCDHYPCDESQQLLPLKYSYQDFLKCCKIDYCGKRLKTERIPFSNFESNDGYVEQIYSCNGPIEFVSFKIYVKKDNALQQIDHEGISSYEIIKTKLPKHPERCRFRTSIAFPDKGLYKVSMFIDGPGVVDYYVNSLQKCTTSVPLKVNLYDEPKFIPISPKTIVTSVNNGYALIRFAVAPKRSKLLWKITKLSNPNSLEKNGQEISKEFGRYITLTIPFDKERYEDQLCITFPSNGRFHVLVYLSNDAGSYTSHANYYFDVKGASSSNPKPINPSSLMFKGRTFAPAPIYDKSNNEVIIKPNQNCYFVEQKEQTLLIKTANADDNIHLELQKDNKTIIFVKQDGQEGDFKRFSWTMPDEAGEYFLEGWINKGYCISLTYIVSKDKLKEPTKEENELLDDLKNKTCSCEPQKAQKQEGKQKKQEQQNAETDKKKSSKCCLLI